MPIFHQHFDLLLNRLELRQRLSPTREQERRPFRK